jgi:hypothetical protein
MLTRNTRLNDKHDCTTECTLWTFAQHANIRERLRHTYVHELGIIRGIIRDRANGCNHHNHAHRHRHNERQCLISSIFQLQILINYMRHRQRSISTSVRNPVSQASNARRIADTFPTRRCQATVLENDNAVATPTRTSFESIESASAGRRAV